MIGWDGSSLVKVTYDDEVRAFVPGLSNVEQMARLPDGDIVAADSTGKRLFRIAPDGSTSTLTGDAGSVYGVLLGPDGQIYTANERSILRVDPDSGDAQQYLSLPADIRPHAMTFDRDCSHLFVATAADYDGGDTGWLYVVDLDAEYNPIGAARPFAQAGNRWQDSATMDACGNLYVAEFGTRGLFRISPTGEVSELYSQSRGKYGHGVRWGNGIGGWREDAIYLPQPYDKRTVRELVIGVPVAAVGCG